MSHATRDELDRRAAATLEEIEKRSDELRPRERMAFPPQPMPAQSPDTRVKNIREVPLGYTPAQAKVEALRCLQCPTAPCVKGCPVAIDIPAFVAAIAREDYREAIDTIKRNSLLPAVCGRVCPQESQCMEPCTMGKARKTLMEGIAVGRLERFAADWEREQGRRETPAIKPDTGRKVAVVGSGPAGITVAADVRREGHAVTLFEAFHKPGGVLMYGIPEFRLPKKIVEEEIDTLRAMGVTLRTNFIIGRTRKLRDLMTKDGFDAVFIGSGAGLPKFMGIEGENLVGVFSANEYLTRANLMRAYDDENADTPIRRGRKVAVLGGGNVAMDAARTALRLGAKEVHLIYRRTEKEMPARVEEVEHAKEEGVEFHTLVNAARVIGDSEHQVRALECIRYRLGEPDDSGRARPVPIDHSEFPFEVDTVIVAIGNESNPLIKMTTPELETDKYGHIVVDENKQTSIPGVFAGGDIVLGAATVILAMGEGRIAAAAINKLLREKP